MSFVELFLLAIGLSMDAFAVAICSGLTMPKLNIKKALIIALYFGVFQAAMPLIGYFAASLFAEKIAAYDHWIAFVLLCFLGGKMIAGSFRKEGCPDRQCPDGASDAGSYAGGNSAGASYAGGNSAGASYADGMCGAGTCSDRTCPGGKRPDRGETSVGPAHMLPLAVATSIDALAVGVSFAFLRISIAPAVTLIGVTTFALSFAGVKVGNAFGTRFKARAELAGGIILVLIGVKILLESLIAA